MGMQLIASCGLLRGSVSLLRAPARAPSRALVPARRWNQCAMLISTPPRNRMTLGMCLAHGAFMMVVWIAPLLILFSQVKIWRRRYLQAA